ncbi:cell wall-associated NlpC family hydrolase [Catenulispora sp. MAP5-51]|uniref:C40 family peptidase n=1 Tax=Catenulispora sp. MAP5-51 TaxID=3156298 RepID=UPI003513539A
MASVFTFLIVLIIAAASAVTAAISNPLGAVWHAVAHDSARTPTVFSGEAYLDLIVAAERNAPTIQATVAISFAAAQLGRPYVWGGTGTNNNLAGYDCSGLTQAAYRYAGVGIPRVATAQYEAGNKVDLKSLLPGDLVYYGSTAFAHHVAIYLGSVGGVQIVLDAPRPGAVVRLDPLNAGGDLFAATRPAAASSSTPTATPPSRPSNGQHLAGRV